MNQSSARFSNLLLIGSLFLLSLATIFGYLSFFWIKDFQWGEISGSYWLLVNYNKIIPLLAVIDLVAFGIFIYLSVKPKLNKEKIELAVLGSIMAFVISCIAYIPALFIGFEHLETIAVKNKVYHLTIRYSVLDTNYFLFSCDRFEINCWSIDQSGDYTKVEKATLIYDRSSDKVKVQVGGKEIYSKSP